MDKSEDAIIKNEIMNSAPETPSIIASGPIPEKKPGFFKTKNGKILLLVMGAIVVFGTGIGTALILTSSNRSSETVINGTSEDKTSTEEKTESASKEATAELTKTSSSPTKSDTSSSTTPSSTNIEFGVADGYLNIPSWQVKLPIPNGFAISYRMEGDDTVYITGYSEKRGARPDYADITKNIHGLGAISIHNTGERVLYDSPILEVPQIGKTIYSAGSQAYFSNNESDKKSEIEDRNIVLKMIANIQFLADPYE